MLEILTPREVAEFLHVEPATVQQWLTNGDLAGFDFDGEWRVSKEQLSAFLRETQHRRAVAALKRSLEDPAMWARELDSQSELQADLLAGEYPADSMGAFIQRAILDNAAAKSAGNVIDIKTRKPPE